MYQTVEGRRLALWGFFGAACLISSLTTLPAAAQGKAPKEGNPSASPTPPPPPATPATTAPPQDPSAQAIPPPPPPPAGQGYPPAGQQAYPPYPYPPYGQQPYPPYPGAYPGWRLEPAGAATAKGDDILPYKDGDEIPPGYHKAERNRPGLIIGGAITLGVPWGLSAFAGATLWSSGGRTPWGALVVPVAGPWILMAALDYDRASSAVLFPVLLIDGLVQTGGLVMLLLGLQSRTVLMRDGVALEQPTKALKPEFSVGPGSIGMRMHF